MSLTIDPALVRLLFWAAVLCCAVGQVMIVVGAVRTPLEKSEAGENGSGTVPKPRRWSEVAWSAAPALALALVLAFTWQAISAPISASEHQHAGSAPAQESQ